MNPPIFSRILRGAVSVIPWRLRASIKDLPIVAPFQRWLLARFLEGSEFIHRVDAGPARGLVYPVRLPADKGVWTGTYEAEFAGALARAVEPGDVCLDIGGWHGFYGGIMALACASKVVVFEPLPANCERIRRLIDLNPALPIELVEAAVADRSGTTEFEVMSDSTMAKLAQSSFQVGKRGSHRISVEVVSLDDMVVQSRIPPPRLIKIDVEGAELLVLRGAAKLLRENGPILFMEIHSPELARDCRQFLETLGYGIEVLKEHGPVDPAICHFRASPRARVLTERRSRNGQTAPPQPFDIPILLYHHLVEEGPINPSAYEISVRQFTQQLELLARWGFTVITFATLLRMMDGREPRGPRLVVITFDDAFRSFVKLAYPALKRRGMSATVFVPVGEIGGKNRWDLPSDYPEREVMNADELRAIAAGGMEIGSHGWNHRPLPECSGASVSEELVRSREHLAALGLRADIFAYPYGRYSPENIKMVRSAGYNAAVSIFSDAPSVTANRFAMRRIYVHPGDNVWRFRCKLSPAYLRYKAQRGIPREGDTRAE